MKDLNTLGDTDLTAEEESIFAQMLKGGTEPPASEPATEPDTPAPDAENNAATAATSAEKEPAKEPATEDDDAEAIVIGDDGRVRDKRGKFVPHRALHAEREEHKKTKAALAEKTTMEARLDERLQILLRSLNQGQPEAAAPANPAAAPAAP